MPQPRHKRRTHANRIWRTKLAPPRLPAELIVRPSLLARLDEGMVNKLTMISAPAGYGKTTLVAQWLATRRERSAWVALDPGDDDPVRFWTYVITACQAFMPGLGKTALADLRAVQLRSFEAPLTSFVDELAALPTPGILVLEDYHVITTAQIHAGLVFLLDHLPDTLHLLLMTRGEPPLHLPRLRVQNKVAEINATDLQFSREETEAFVRQQFRLPLAPETVARLDAQTEGWAAGLRLVALAAEGKRDLSSIQQFLATFSGGHHHVIEYLAAEVLAAQPEATQVFLLQTSILHRFTAALCNAVTSRNDSASILAQLERANLFVLRLGSEGDQVWYRYHALFAEAMRQAARERLTEDDLNSLYARASAWYEKNGFFDAAIDMAISAQQFERAAILMERSFERRAGRELYTFRRRVERIPLQVLKSHPALCFEHALALLFTSDRYAASTAALIERPLRMAEEAWQYEKNHASLGRVLALRGLVSLWQGDLAGATSFVADSLQLLPEDDAFWRGSDLIIVGIEETLAGRLETAQNVLIEARALSGAAQSAEGQLAATGLLADVYVRQGEFDQAVRLYEQVRAEAVGSEDMLDDQGTASLGLGAIAYERNDLDSAEREATGAYELGSQRSNEVLAVHAGLLLARVWVARGKMEQAREKLRTLIAQTRHPYFVQEVLAYQARLALLAGDIEAAHHWYAGVAQSSGELPPILQEYRDLTVARMQIADREFPTALELLQRWQVDAEHHGRTSSELEALVLEALAYLAQSDRPQANRALLRAVAIAQPRGYQRVFLDEGDPIRLLISDPESLIDKQAPRLRAFLYKLLSAFSDQGLALPPKFEPRNPWPATTRPARKGGPRSPIPFDPLSPQEQRVLRLLSAGLSNPEIARELVVSTNTIKTQLQSIYRKLNVNNRDEARQIARDLNFL